MSEKRKKRIILLTTIIFILVILAAGCFCWGIYYKNGNKKSSDDKKDIIDEHQVEIVEKSDASYERWLAAGIVTAVSMQYPDFEIEGIYLTGETDSADRMQSGGAYVIFTADGTETAVQSMPLEAERTDAGTTDLYTRDLGFATFDVVDPAQIDTGSCVEVSMDELEELISQSLLVSLYEH